MGILKSKHKKIEKIDHTKEVFLVEALGHTSVYDIVSDSDKKIILPKGSLVTPRTVGFLAEMGIDRIYIYEKPEISLLVIGSEFMAPGGPVKPDKIYDSNSPMLQAALATLRIRPVFMRRLADEPKLLRRLIPFALNQSNIVILVSKETEEERAMIGEILKNVDARIVNAQEKDSLENLHLTDPKEKKIIFWLPYDPNFILDYFFRCIQPAIQFFMGYTNPLSSEGSIAV